MELVVLMWGWLLLWISHVKEVCLFFPLYFIIHSDISVSWSPSYSYHLPFCVKIALFTVESCQRFCQFVKALLWHANILSSSTVLPPQGCGDRPAEQVDLPSRSISINGVPSEVQWALVLRQGWAWRFWSCMDYKQFVRYEVENRCATLSPPLPTFEYVLFCSFTSISRKPDSRQTKLQRCTDPSWWIGKWSCSRASWLCLQKSESRPKARANGQCPMKGSHLFCDVFIVTYLNRSMYPGIPATALADTRTTRLFHVPNQEAEPLLFFLFISCRVSLRLAISSVSYILRPFFSCVTCFLWWKFRGGHGFLISHKIAHVYQVSYISGACFAIFCAEETSRPFSVCFVVSCRVLPVEVPPPTETYTNIRQAETPLVLADALFQYLLFYRYAYLCTCACHRSFVFGLPYREEEELALLEIRELKISAKGITHGVRYTEWNTV